MQWLIDIITSLFDDRHRYFDRGDPAVADFAIGDLNLNNFWHVLDLSAIVPAGAVAVNLKLNIRADQINKIFQVRPNGQANTWNSVALWTQVANQQLGGVYVVGIDSNRFVEYKGSFFTFNVLNILVCGWWLK